MQFVKLAAKGKTSQKVTKLNGNENGEETHRGGEEANTLLWPLDVAAESRHNELAKLKGNQLQNCFII